jgi:hypothetical protein
VSDLVLAILLIVAVVIVVILLLCAAPDERPDSRTEIRRIEAERDRQLYQLNLQAMHTRQAILDAARRSQRR